MSAHRWSRGRGVILRASQRLDGGSCHRHTARATSSPPVHSVAISQHSRRMRPTQRDPSSACASGACGSVDAKAARARRRWRRAQLGRRALLSPWPTSGVKPAGRSDTRALPCTSSAYSGTRVFRQFSRHMRPSEAVHPRVPPPIIGMVHALSACISPLRIDQNACALSAAACAVCGSAWSLCEPVPSSGGGVGSNSKPAGGGAGGVGGVGRLSVTHMSTCQRESSGWCALRAVRAVESRVWADLIVAISGSISRTTARTKPSRYGRTASPPVSSSSRRNHSTMTPRTRR